MDLRGNSSATRYRASIVSIVTTVMRDAVGLQIGLQGRRNFHAAIGLLMRLDSATNNRASAVPLPLRMCGNLFSPASVLNRRFIRRDWKSSQFEQLETSR